MRCIAAKSMLDLPRFVYIIVKTLPLERTLSCERSQHTSHLFRAIFNNWSFHWQKRAYSIYIRTFFFTHVFFFWRQKHSRAFNYGKMRGAGRFHGEQCKLDCAVHKYSTNENWFWRVAINNREAHCDRHLMNARTPKPAEYCSVFVILEKSG